MKTEEVIIMVQVCRENGRTTGETVNFINFVDAALWTKKRQMLINHQNKTRAGYSRKDSLPINVLKDLVKGLMVADMEAIGEDTTDLFV